MIFKYFFVKDSMDKFKDIIEVVEHSQEKLVEFVENSVDKPDIVRSMLKILLPKFY